MFAFFIKIGLYTIVRGVSDYQSKSDRNMCSELPVDRCGVFMHETADREVNRMIYLVTACCMFPDDNRCIKEARNLIYVRT